MSWHNYFIEDGTTRLCRLAQRDGITVKMVPVPERHASVTNDTSGSDVSERDDQEVTEYRGFIVVELCWPPTFIGPTVGLDKVPTVEHPKCWFSRPAKPLVAIDQAIGYLVCGEGGVFI